MPDVAQVLRAGHLQKHALARITVGFWMAVLERDRLCPPKLGGVPVLLRQASLLVELWLEAARPPLEPSSVL
eukprot:3843989-Pyramimonas_sp.AAC.1